MFYQAAYTYGAGFGLDAELAAKMMAKYDVGKEQEAQAWIEAVLGEPFPGSFADSLKDGVILCRSLIYFKPRDPIYTNPYPGS